MKTCRKKLWLRLPVLLSVGVAFILIASFIHMTIWITLVTAPKTSVVHFIKEDPSLMKEEQDLINVMKKELNEVTLLTPINYTVPGCSCVRVGFEMEEIRKAQQDIKEHPSFYSASFLERYNFEGESTCSDYATQRGGGQKVVSYSYYTRDEKVDIGSKHSKRYIGQLPEKAAVIKKSYPGWNMRIYHNITEDDIVGNQFLCRIFCQHQHVDLCHVYSLPGIGNLVKRDVVGRLWRFAVMGDPTVSTFLIRDSDSLILDREVTVVKEWFASDKGFHTMRDHPLHTTMILAGLWGGRNKDLNLMKRLRDEMFSRPLNLHKGFDQTLLQTVVWPHIKNDTMKHASYNCGLKDHEDSRPFPVQRSDGIYVGWSPLSVKNKYRNDLLKLECPLECRPKSHKDWIYC